VAAVMLAGRGSSVSMWNVVTVSLRQQIVPPPLLGRVNSVYRMAGWGLMPAGALAGGFVAHAAGLHAPFLAGAALCALSLLAAAPLLLSAGRATPVRSEIQDLLSRTAVVLPPGGGIPAAPRVVDGARPGRYNRAGYKPLN
jgi:hypothetical protein